MLRRLASLGHLAAESAEPMTPSPGDAPQSSDAKGGGAGGGAGGSLVSVFKGLAGGKLTNKSPSPLPSQASSVSSTAHLSSSQTALASTLDALRHGNLAERTAAAASIRQAIADQPLDPVLGIWDAAKDLIDPSHPSSARVAGWGLLSECVKHEASTDLERNEFFQTLSETANPEDFHLQLAALVGLTRHGRDLSGFDYDVIPLLSSWLQQVYGTVKAARRQSSRGANKVLKGKTTVSAEDKNFAQLFSFILDVLKFNFKVAGDGAVSNMIQSLLDICVSTSVEEDLRSCITVFNAIVTFGSVPTEKLSSCVTVLGSIHSLVPTLHKDAWHALANLFRSHNGQETVRILLNVLRKYPQDGGSAKDAVREVRGALSILQKLVSKSTEKGYPLVPFNLLVDGLVNVVTKASSPKTAVPVLRLINTLFGDGDGKMNNAILEEDWTGLFSVAAECARKAPSPSANGDATHSSSGSASRSLSAKDAHEITLEARVLVGRLEAIMKEHPSDLLQRPECIVFFTKVHAVLPDSAAIVVLDYFHQFGCCFPSDEEWELNLKLVLDSFYADRNRSTAVRARSLQLVTEAHDMLELVEDQIGEQCVPNLVKDILAGIAEEQDTVVLQDTVAFVVSVAKSAAVDLFDAILDSLKGVILNDRTRSPISSSPAAPAAESPRLSERSSPRPAPVRDQSPSNVVTRGYVQMFMQALNTDVTKATKTFSALVLIARSNLHETDARLTAMKLLFRLRADWANRIFITPFAESEGLAASLYRTEASLARKLAEDAAQPSRLSKAEQGTTTRSSRVLSAGQAPAAERGLLVRSVSSAVKPVMHKYQQMWALPDPDALPERPSTTASPVLFSHLEQREPPDGGSEQTTTTTTTTTTGSLNLASWLEALLVVLLQGCDWEVYSYVLVHLPSQLSNHAVFRDATGQVQEMRKALCEQIRTNGFQEPPNSSGLRRPDVATCLFHVLVMIMSYHEHFQKGEEDELVRTFLQGISDRTAKCCIHALSICCHELPMSVSKSLVTILQRMAQIITQPFVAMHILEFLACLCRLPQLYSNFREDEYRIVFGICFRYLHTVRDKRRAARLSHPHPGDAPGPASAAADTGHNTDDLPQYVYALAYHVITFWFLALKLPDRPNLVGWIAKNLFTDADGGQSYEEQAQTTFDFMQRVTYADADDSVEDPLFTPERFGEIQERRWVIGNSIITIKQVTESGWAEITRRQPSGTSCFTIREKLRPPPAHQTGNLPEGARDMHQSAAAAAAAPSNVALPSHLLVQLLSSLPQSCDPALRPVPLPDDEAVGRAIRLFDRNSTVDGHKVGVIYIGENQTTEVEILANTSGSDDYVQFLNGLGTLTKLKGAAFNTQGLDREYDTDGQYTFCWRDRVTEIVFHVTTQMPTNLERDAQCIGKKRHIGNDFVNIIFNDAGLPFRFDTFPSEFNYVNIVITPESRASFVAQRARKSAAAAAAAGAVGGDAFYKVQVMSKPGFPEISPAADTKMVSLKALPDFIRLLALNASVFSLVWANRAEGGENVSSWGNRLREINRLRERYGPKLPPAASAAATSSPPPTSLGGAGVTPIGGGSGGGSGGGGMGGSSQLLPPLQQPPVQVTAAAPAGGDGSRPSSSVRDSFSSLRRSSVATFFTSTSDQMSHRTSITSTAPTMDNAEYMPPNGVDSLVDSLDFSKWA